MASSIPLPIDEFISRITEILSRERSLVLSAAPGAGKTTRVPPAALKCTEKSVWVLEPRRIAAIAAAQRIAEEQGWTLGEEVGYQVRFENKSSANTRLLFLTEALLLRKMLRDPKLSNVGCVILDEFHERSLHVDLALGALKELQDLERPDLKIIVMSATLDSQPLSKYLDDATCLDVPGKLYPLEIISEDKPQLLKTDGEWVERMRRLVQKAASEQEGNLLCFLPGRGEIERLKAALSGWANNNGIFLFGLHGQLNLQGQREALAPSQGSRKIILATNVAESSLTVPGVRVVVDSGLARALRFNPRTGLESLDLTRISQASATQRAGRAAREAPGFVYRAWTPFDERSMEAFEVPEIFNKDLAETVLLLAALGVTQPENFLWFESPPAQSIKVAQNFLKNLGALTEAGALTPLGASLREFPLHPRLAKLLMVGRERGLSGLAADLCALLAEGKSSKTFAFSGAENDVWARFEEWKRNSKGHRTLERTALQLRKMIGAYTSEAPASEADLVDLLLAAYPDRLCRRRRPHEPEGKMVGGRGVKLHPESSVRTSEFFLSIEMTEGRDAASALVFQAVGVPASMIQEEIEPKSTSQVELEWDKEKEQFFVIETRMWHGLSVGKERRRSAQPAEIEGRLADVLVLRWSRLLESNEELGRWISRLHYLHRFHPHFPNFSPEQIKEGLEAASYGEKQIADVERKDLIPYFENLLSKEHRTALDRECPKAWVVPTGNRIPIKYSEEQGALVEVRLQELFGLEKPPLIAGQPLTLFLLAPNYRPVQVTRDLQSFWTNGYPEVRREMRARYPKHSWPEDPRTAPPQAKGRFQRK